MRRDILLYLTAYEIEGKVSRRKFRDIMHHSTGIKSLGAKEGVIGIFTQNRLNREQVLTQIVKALIGQYHYYPNLKAHLSV